ncbi:MAG: hypothetical protein ACXVPU_02560 [Bacteroidia bacterium]
MGLIIIWLFFSIVATIMGIIFCYLPKSDAEQELKSEKEISQAEPLTIG